MPIARSDISMAAKGLYRYGHGNFVAGELFQNGVLFGGFGADLGEKEIVAGDQIHQCTEGNQLAADDRNNIFRSCVDSHCHISKSLGG